MYALEVLKEIEYNRNDVKDRLSRIHIATIFYPTSENIIDHAIFSDLKDVL